MSKHHAPSKTKWTQLLWLSPIMLTLIGGITGCERSGKRVKMSKPPNPLVTARNQPVKGDRLSGSRDALVRSAQLTVSDAVATLGGFVYQANATYRYKRGTKSLKLVQTYRLEQRKNGVFRSHVTSKGKQGKKGYEVIWLNQALYQRERLRPFRIISKEVKEAHRWQRRGYGRWRSIVGLFGPRLALSQNGSGQHLQRNTTRYSIALHRTPQPIKLPKYGTAWDGPVPNSTRGSAAKYKRTLRQASGTVEVDQKSGLVLKVNFKGSYQIGEGKDTTIANITLNASFVSTGDPDINVPKQVTSIKREPDPLDPFQGKMAPSYMLPPPSLDDKKKKRRRRRRKR